MSQKVGYLKTIKPLFGKMSSVGPCCPAWGLGFEKVTI